MICVLIQVELVQLRKQTNSGTATANDDGNYKGMRQYKLPALLQKFTHTKQSCVCSVCYTHTHMYECAQHLYTYCNTRARVARPTVCGMWPHIHYMCT